MAAEHVRDAGGMDNVKIKMSGDNPEHVTKSPSSPNSVQDSLNALLSGDIQAFIGNADSTILIGICVAVFVVLLTIFLALRKGSSRKRSVLLVGLSDAGKTLLFLKLAYRKQITTQASIKENSADYSANGKLKHPVRLVDIPGHDKLRHQFVDKFKAGARGIIFVVDSLNLQKEIKDVAEFLYVLLTDSSLNRSAPALLIACNKQDHALAKGAKLIQSLLEKELNAARISKSASLSATDGTGRNGVTPLGKPGQEFSFSDVRHFRVEFVECSARGGKEEDCSGIGNIEDWIAKIA